MKALEQFRSEFSSYSSAQVRELIRTDGQFRQRLETLYESVFHKKLNKGCTSCWLDAFVLLRSKSIEKLTTMAKRQFELKAGVVLRDVVNHDDALLATHHNLTDELAIYHLRTNPNCKSKFSKLPSDWERRVAAAAAAAAADKQAAEHAEHAEHAEAAVEGDDKDVAAASEGDSSDKQAEDGVDAADAIRKAEIAKKAAETRLKNAQAAGNEDAIARAQNSLAIATEKLAALQGKQE